MIGGARAWMAPALVLVGLATAACTIQPRDSVAVAFYMRDLSGEPHWYRFLGEHPDPAPFFGQVTAEPRTTGCGFVAADWELIVTGGDRPPDPADDFVAHVTAADFGNEDPTVLALSIGPDGSAMVEEGVPSWWESDVQVCP